MLRDRLAHRAALLRVAERVFEARARDAERLCGDADAPAVERGHRDFETLPDFTEQVRFGKPHVVEKDLRRLAAANAELVVGLTDAHALRLHRQDERGDAAMTRRS